MNTLASEIYRLRAGIRNKDFRPGKELRDAETRLMALTGENRVRGVIKLGNAG